MTFVHISEMGSLEDQILDILKITLDDYPVEESGEHITAEQYLKALKNTKEIFLSSENFYNIIRGSMLFLIDSIPSISQIKK